MRPILPGLVISCKCRWPIYRIGMSTESTTHWHFYLHDLTEPNWDSQFSEKKHKMSWLRLRECIGLLTATTCAFDQYPDHVKLLSIFGPLSIVPDLSETSLRKFLRWAVRSSTYSYTWCHIKVEDNVFADLLGRGAAIPTVRRLVRVPVLPSSSAEGFIRPSVEELEKDQEKHYSTLPPMHVFGNMF